MGQKGLKLAFWAKNSSYFAEFSLAELRVPPPLAEKILSKHPNFDNFLLSAGVVGLKLLCILTTHFVLTCT